MLNQTWGVGRFRTVKSRGVELALRNELPIQRKRQRLMLVAAIIAGSVLVAPGAASAEGLFDFLFGGIEKPQQRQAPQANLFADPFGTGQQAAPPPSRPAVASSGPAFCVRSCDGRYFPLIRGTAAPAQICQAFCPASPTKVFFGSSIDSAYAANGEHYADSENAFLYRKELRASCTCNGRDPAGLAPVDLALELIAPSRRRSRHDRRPRRLFGQPLRLRPERRVHADRVLSGIDQRCARAAERNKGRPGTSGHDRERRAVIDCGHTRRAAQHHAASSNPGQARGSELRPSFRGDAPASNPESRGYGARLRPKIAA